MALLNVGGNRRGHDACNLCLARQTRALRPGQDDGPKAQAARRINSADNVPRTPARTDADGDVALAPQRPNLACEHLLESVVVGDSRQGRTIRGERDRRQCLAIPCKAADKLRSHVLRIGCATPIPEQQELVAGRKRLVYELRRCNNLWQARINQFCTCLGAVAQILLKKLTQAFRCHDAPPH